MFTYTSEYHGTKLTFKSKFPLAGLDDAAAHDIVGAIQELQESIAVCTPGSLESLTMVIT